MSILIPENTNRKLDNIGRITLPKGLRNRFCLDENSELELYTAMIEGKNCIVLAKEMSNDEKIKAGVAELKALGMTADDVYELFEDE